MGSAGWTVCHSFKTNSCCDEKVCARMCACLCDCRFVSRVANKPVCLRSPDFAVVSHNTFDSGQIKKSVRVCWSSKQSPVDTLHWGLVKHFRDSRDKMCHLKALCSVTLLQWQLSNHVSQATLKVHQIMAFCAVRHSVFFTERRVCYIYWLPVRREQLQSPPILFNLNWGTHKNSQRPQIPHYFLVPYLRLSRVWGKLMIPETPFRGLWHGTAQGCSCCLLEFLRRL